MKREIRLYTPDITGGEPFALNPITDPHSVEVIQTELSRINTLARLAARSLNEPGTDTTPTLGPPHAAWNNGVYLDLPRLE